MQNKKVVNMGSGNIVKRWSNHDITKNFKMQNKKVVNMGSGNTSKFAFQKLDHCQPPDRTCKWHPGRWRQYDRNGKNGVK